MCIYAHSLGSLGCYLQAVPFFWHDLNLTACTELRWNLPFPPALPRSTNLPGRRLLQREYPFDRFDLKDAWKEERSPDGPTHVGGPNWCLHFSRKDMIWLSPCSLVPQMLQLCGDSVVTGTEWCGFSFWLSPIFHRRFQDVSRSFAGEMCWSTVSNLSFRKFAVFASRFSWVFSPDICWSKSEVPEEHLQVRYSRKNFKVELDHWHLTAKSFDIWKCQAAPTKYSFYSSITLEHVLKCSSPLYLCGILRSLENWCFFSMFLHVHPFVTKMTQGQSADVMSTTTQKASAMANFVKWTDHEMILQNSINCYSKWGFKFAVLCWFPSSPRYMRVYVYYTCTYVHIYTYVYTYQDGTGWMLLAPPQPPTHPILTMSCGYVPTRHLLLMKNLLDMFQKFPKFGFI